MAMTAGTMSRPLGRLAHADVLRPARLTALSGLARRTCRGFPSPPATLPAAAVVSARVVPALPAAARAFPPAGSAVPAAAPASARVVPASALVVPASARVVPASALV